MSIHKSLLAFIIMSPIIIVNVGFASDIVTDSSLQTRPKRDQYLRRSEEGWHFYNEVIEAKKKEPDDKKVKITRETPSLRPLTPREELQRIQDELENARAEAVLRPSEKSLRNYLQQNLWMMRQSALFADTWRRVVWQTPSLDYSQRRPNNNLALQVFHDDRNKVISTAIEEVAREYGIWFFYRGECPYCHRFSPIIKTLADQSGLKIMPISLDGGSLREFPTFRYDTQVARELGVTVVPSVYLVNPKTRSIIPVANGLVSLQELKERIYILTKTKPGDDF